MPIVQSTTYTYDSSEAMGDLFDLKAEGFFYTRLGNPTLDAVEKKIAALEGGVGALLTSSGQAASLIAVLNICHAGDHVVASNAIYGGTFNLIYKTMQEMGIDSTFVAPGCSREELEAAFRPNTKCVFAETLSNPSLVVTDLELFAEESHAHGVPLIVDNTFPTPINCRPFEFGADIVTHSTTKYMDGHAVQVGGVIVDSGNFDWTEREISHVHRAGRILSWYCICETGRQSCLYHQSTYPSDAGSGGTGGTSERFSAEFGPRDSCFAHGTALQKRSGRGGIFGEKQQGCMGELSGTCQQPLS